MSNLEPASIKLNSRSFCQKQLHGCPGKYVSVDTEMFHVFLEKKRCSKKKKYSKSKRDVLKAKGNLWMPGKTRGDSWTPALVLKFNWFKLPPLLLE